ncbi:hypothetical protein ACLOJK_040748 [Asimina triloba]
MKFDPSENDAHRTIDLASPHASHPMETSENFLQVREQSAPSEPLANVTPVASVMTHTRTIGIIHPPRDPDARTIIDTTAQLVAKNGPPFEKRIRVENSAKVKFSQLLE